MMFAEKSTIIPEIAFPFGEGLWMSFQPHKSVFTYSLWKISSKTVIMECKRSKAAVYTNIKRQVFDL